MTDCIVCISGLPADVSEQRIKDELDQIGTIEELYIEKPDTFSGLVRSYVKIKTATGLKKLCACLSKMIFTEIKVNVKPVAIIPLALTQKNCDSPLSAEHPFALPRKPQDDHVNNEHNDSYMRKRTQPSNNHLQSTTRTSNAEDSLILCVAGFPRDATEEDVISDLSPKLANITRAVIDNSGEKTKAYVEISPASEISIGHKRLCAFLTKELSSASCKFTIKIVDKLPNLRQSGIQKAPSVYNDNNAVDYSHENTNNSEYFPRNNTKDTYRNDTRRYDYNSDGNQIQKRSVLRQSSPPRVHYDPTKDDHSCFELGSEMPSETPVVNVAHNIKDLFSSSQSKSSHFTFGFSSGDTEDNEQSEFLSRGAKQAKMFNLPTADKLQKVQFFNPQPTADIVARSKLSKNKFSRKSMKLKRMPFWAKKKLVKNKPMK